jgi:predicted neuraminidase
MLKLLKSAFVLFFFAVCSEASAGKEAWILKEEFLSSEKKDFDCHSSSIVTTTPGALCAVWKGGPGEGKSNIYIANNVGVWLSLFDGNHWSEPRELVSIPHSVCWNPVLCALSPEELLLFYRVGPDPRRVVSFLKRSSDGGKTWSQEEILPAGIFGPTKNKPIVTAEGTLICPSSVSVGEPSDTFKATACWIEISEDKGIHWKKIGPFEIADRKFGVIEPTLFFDAHGHLHMLCRDRAYKIGGTGYIWQAVSEDGGLRWSELKKTQLPNPDAAIDTVDLGEGKIVLIYNHSHTDRFPLNLALSLDGGTHWSDPVSLDDRGEFPSATLTPDGLIHVTYAFSASDHEQRRIKHLVIILQQLLKDLEF